MHSRLVVTIHLDAFDLAVGGGWTEFDRDGYRIGSEAYPSFGNELMTPEEAGQEIISRWLLSSQRQLTLFAP